MNDRIGDKLTYQWNDQWGNPSDKVVDFVCVGNIAGFGFRFESDVHAFFMTTQELHSRANDGEGRILTYTENKRHDK